MTEQIPGRGWVDLFGIDPGFTDEPARVVPSDFIDAMVREIDAEAVSYRAVTDHGQHAEPLTVVSGSDFADVIARRIYRLLSAAPTEAEVARAAAERAWDEGERHESEYLMTFGQFCSRGHKCNPYRADRLAEGGEA